MRGDLFRSLLALGVPSVKGLFVHNPINAINGSLWTLPYEYVCYLGLLAFGILGILKKRIVVAFFFALSLLWYVASLTLPLHVLHLHPLPSIWGGDGQGLDGFAHFSTDFLAGSLCYLYRECIHLSLPLFLLALLSMVGSCLFSIGPYLAIPIFGTYMLLYIAFIPLSNLHRFARHGDLSYGTYIYAFPVQQLLVQYWGTVLTPITLFCCATPITYGLAMLSWRFIERPALSRKYAMSAVVERRETAERTAAP